MLLHFAATETTSSPQGGVLVFTLVLGLAFVISGGVVTLNIRGAADSLHRRRRAGLEFGGQQRMDLTLADRRDVPQWAYRLVGGIVVACGMVVLLVFAALATRG